MPKRANNSVSKNDYSRVSVLFVIGLIVLFLLSLLTYLLPFVDTFGQDLGTPGFSMKPANPTNPLYPAAFYYTTDDDVTIYDTLELTNIDSSRGVTLELTGKIQGSEGWFSFSSATVDVPAYSIFTPETVTVAITLPDGICTDVYTARIVGTLVDYDGIPVDQETLLSTSIGVEVMFDVVSGVPCLGGEVLPGLGAAPSFVPPPTFIAEIIEAEPVIIPGGGGGGVVLLGGGGTIPPVEDPVVEDPVVEDPVVEDPVVEDPVVEDPVVEDPVVEDPVLEEPVVEEPVVEEPVAVFMNLAAYPEKRIPSIGNWGTRGILDLYGFGSLEPDHVFAAPTSSEGITVIENNVDAGIYHASYKGLSHLTRFMRNIQFIEGESVDLDFTELGTYFLLAGDVALSKDDYINSLDIVATMLALYDNEEHADLNADGIVNGLDLSIEVFNLYKSGETRVSS